LGLLLVVVGRGPHEIERRADGVVVARAVFIPAPESTSGAANPTVKRKFVANRGTSSYIPRMTRFNLARLAVVGTLITFALPLASHAEEPGPVTPKTTTPSDTLTKLDKAKSDRPAPSSKKKLKGRQAAPAQPRSSYGPDQPWETEFYVENDIAAQREMQLALASFGRHR
jgi:hypothetical protein